MLRGGENLLEKVEALEAAAARQQEALAAQRVAQAAAQARLAQLQAAASQMEGRYSSAQVGVNGGGWVVQFGLCTSGMLQCGPPILLQERKLHCVLPPPLPPPQEEIAAKQARLERLAGAAGAARQEAAALGAQCQAEWERLLGDIRRLTAQIAQKVGRSRRGLGGGCALGGSPATALSSHLPEANALQLSPDACRPPCSPLPPCSPP